MPRLPAIVLVIVAITSVLPGCAMLAAATAVPNGTVAADPKSTRPVTARPVALSAASGSETVAQRLDRLEQGLAELRIAMSRVDAGALAAEPPTGLSTTSRSLRDDLHTQASLQALMTTPGLESSAMIPPEQQPSADLFAIHLASFRTPQLVAQGWQRISRLHARILKTLQPVHARVSLEERGVYYRLKAGPFRSWRAAETVCAELRVVGQDCAVMDYAGEPIGQPTLSGL